MENFSITTLKGGAVIEALDAEIDRVLDNIVDPNTDPDKARAITLTIRFKPNKERTACVISAQAKSTLAADSAIETAAMVGRDGKRGVARELSPIQPELPVDTPQEKPRLQKIG